MEQTKTVRVRKINPFLQSNGVVLKKNFLLMFFISFEFILTFIMYIDYQFFSKTELDIFEVLNRVSGDIFILNRYFLLHYTDNFIISTFNGYISDIKGNSLSIPYFFDYINYKNFTINFYGYLEITIRFIITIFIYLLTILQIRDQQKYRSIGLHSIYSPLILILFSKYYKEYHFFKRVGGIKRDMLNVDKKREIIQLFFNKNEIFLNNNINDIQLKTSTFSIFHGFYNYYRISLMLKPQKSKK
ncbi:MAG: hypothetical protein ACNI28_10315 [Arcobacter sp.]|uniref:hypothetical protein n=1 Tax=Arcobacter sp. TaxID=1872629 RepID=UPI003B0069E3